MNPTSQDPTQPADKMNEQVDVSTTLQKSSNVPDTQLAYAPSKHVPTSGKGDKKRPNKIIIVSAAALIALGTGGYVFGFYIPNKPENVWNSALKNTGEGYDTLIDYTSDDALAKKYKTAEASGDYEVTTDDMSTDGEFQIKSGEKDATFSADMGLGVTRVELEGVVKDVDSSESPDVFVKLNGIKGLGGEMLPELDTLDNQWISIDHTFLDTLTQQASGEEASMPTKEDFVAAAHVVGQVSKKYLFTDDERHAALIMHEYAGKETLDGKEMLHYKVRADKENLQAFAKELGVELDKTKLSNTVKETYGKSLSDQLDIKSLEKAAGKLKGTETFDAWVNAETKLIHKVRFYDATNADNNVEIGLNYDGGDEMSLFLNTASADNMTASLNITLNTKTDMVKVTADLDSDAESAAYGMKLDMNVKPGTGSVTVAAPENTITLMEALDRLGLGAYLELFTEGLMNGLSEGTSASTVQINEEYDTPVVVTQ